MMAGGLSTGLAGCGRKRAPVQAPEKPKPKSTFTGLAKGLRLQGTDEQGRPLYEVRSRVSVQSQAREDVTLTNTSVTLYHEGKPQMFVDAPNTRVDAKTRKLVMWGGLSARAPERNASFRVARLTWSYNTKQFEGTGGVVFTQPPLRMRADRISGKTPVKTVDLDGGVRLDVQPASR